MKILIDVLKLIDGLIGFLNHNLHYPNHSIATYIWCDRLGCLTAHLSMGDSEGLMKNPVSVSLSVTP